MSVPRAGFAGNGGTGLTPPAPPRAGIKGGPFPSHRPKTAACVLPGKRPHSPPPCPHAAPFPNSDVGWRGVGSRKAGETRASQALGAAPRGRARRAPSRQQRARARNDRGARGPSGRAAAGTEARPSAPSPRVAGAGRARPRRVPSVGLMRGGGGGSGSAPAGTDFGALVASVGSRGSWPRPLHAPARGGGAGGAGRAT